ncbi:MAG: hypothetical protein K8R48_05985 [Alphaproteobacteria bacterium]|nr:hypothetical protein [Alphaproteobacteria bacterium]
MSNIVVHVGAPFYWPEDFNINAITKKNVRIAAWLKLPFRYRTGDLFHLDIDESAGIDIWIYNRFPIPEGESYEKTHQRLHEAGYKRGVDYPRDHSEAIIILKNPQVTSLRQENLTSDDGFSPPAVQLPYFRVLQILNEFTCAYATTTNELFGGAALKPLSNAEFFDSLWAEVTLLCPHDYNIQEPEILEMVQWVPERDFRVISTRHGEVSDLPKEKLEIKPVLKKIRDHAFHELAFKAKVEMVSHEPITALVLICAAMEGAHAAFLHQAIKRMPGEYQESLVNQLLREQGISTLVQITPKIFLPVDKQPNVKTLKECVSALQARNDIMHAKSSKGTYAMRKHTNSDLNNHYSALLTMYNFFVSIID